MLSSKLLAHAAINATLLLILSGTTNAQRAPGADAPPTSAVGACNKFTNAVNPGSKADGSTPAQRTETDIGRIANAGRLGLDCGRAIAELLKNLRTNNGTGTWGTIEKEIDNLVDTYRAVIESIEGTGGVSEEGVRALDVLDANIKDMAARHDPNYQPLIDARRARDVIASKLEITKKLKGALDGQLVDIQSRKREIAEAQGIQRYQAAEQALQSFNDGLTGVVNELTNALKSPTAPGM